MTSTYINKFERLGLLALETQQSKTGYDRLSDVVLLNFGQTNTVNDVISGFRLLHLNRRFRLQQSNVVIHDLFAEIKMNDHVINSVNISFINACRSDTDLPSFLHFRDRHSITKSLVLIDLKINKSMQKKFV